MEFPIREARLIRRSRGGHGPTTVLRPLVIAFALIALLALPASAGAVLPGTNGRIVFISGPAFGNTQLFLRSVTSSTGAGSTTGPLVTGLAQQHRHPTWSPDRTKVAFAEGPGGAIGYDIYILDLTAPGAIPQNITNSSGVTDDRPAWSPDGTRIAYESGNDIIVHPLNGGGDLNLTTTLTPKAWKAAWSPDSQTLYYSVGDITQPPNGNNNDIKLDQQPANNSGAGTELLHISGAHVFQPSISPDGTKLCYTTSTAPGNSTSAAVLAAPLSAPGSFTVIADSGKGDYNCTWSPDGTKIAYTEDYGGSGEIFMKSSDGSGIPVDLTNTAGVFDGNPDWAPDGRPTCPDSATTTKVNAPVTITVACNDTGPAYEQSNVREFNRTGPSHGTVKQELAGDPFVYTPSSGFVGTDSFKVGSFDDFGFGADTGTVTITVRPASGGGGGGGPRPKCGRARATIVGTAGGDVLVGTPGNDVIVGLGGNDQIRGGGGRDIICGGSGRDRVSGAGGNDRIIGGPGDDRLDGGPGNDDLSGNGGNDSLTGGSGKDKLSGNSGRDRLDGGSDRDRCNGGSSRDRSSRCEVRAGIP
jgi:Tol biopolymer transport system component